jgi:hypothetical protein
MVEQTLNTNNAMIDLDLSDLSKKKIRINGDDSKILEINTSDLGLIMRLNEIEPKLDALADKATKLDDLDVNKFGVEGDDTFSTFATTLKEIDDEMRDLMDELFKANVSETCASDGSMFDPINGSTRYEIILSALLQLYDDNVKREMELAKLDDKDVKTINRIHYHTDKYTGKKSTKGK